jgi:hypothetical protein
MNDKPEPLPRAIIAKIEYHLNHIAELFNSPKITLVVRNPELDKGKGDGDLVMTLDDIQLVINALENRQHAAIMADIQTRAKWGVGQDG